MIRKLWSNMIKWGWDYNRLQRGADIPVASVRESESVDVEGLRFVCMPATGGTIVQVRHYDRKSDRQNMITHIITDDEDIANKIGHIVSLELMRAK